MLPLETKQYGGKLLPHSDILWGVFLREVSRSRKNDFFLGTWNVRTLYIAGSLTAAARELARNKNEVDGACGACGGGERCAQGSSGETRGKEAIFWGDPDADGRTILK